MRSLLLCLAFALGVANAIKSYEGYQVLRTERLTRDAVSYLREIESTDLRFDFWLEARNGMSAEIMSAQEDVATLTTLLQEAGIDFTVGVEDVQQLIDTNSKVKGRKLPGKSAKYELDWDAYYRHDAINDFVDELARTHDFAESVVIGKTYEGREMKVLRTNKAGEGAPNVWIEAGIHSREWISPSVATYLMREVVENFANHPEYTDKINFHFLPVANPDGYEYSWTDDRMWRKTRSPNSNGCVGTDSNRNFEYEWGGLGTSDSPCSSSYHGIEPFSEVENRHIRDYVLSLSPTPTLALALHSAAELWLWPYGYDYNMFPDNVKELEALGDAAVEAIYNTHGVTFINENSADLYPAAGDSNDWYTATAGIRFSYTVELRTQGHGFELPPDQIIPSGEEMWAAYMVCLDKVIEVSY